MQHLETALYALVTVTLTGVVAVGCMDEQRTPTDQKEEAAEGPATDFQRWAGDDDAVKRDTFAQALTDMGVYEDWDGNGDQALDPSEFADGVFGVWNDDANNYVTEQEWSEAHTHWYRDDQEHGTFQEWDTDGDDQLSPSEVQTGIVQTNLFANWDHDGSDQIGDEEFVDHSFAVWDRDDNDAIDESEWSSAIEAWQPMAEPEVATVR